MLVGRWLAAAVFTSNLLQKYKTIEDARPYGWFVRFALGHNQQCIREYPLLRRSRRRGAVLVAPMGVRKNLSLHCREQRCRLSVYMCREQRCRLSVVLSEKREKRREKKIGVGLRRRFISGRPMVAPTAALQYARRAVACRRRFYVKPFEKI